MFPLPPWCRWCREYFGGLNSGARLLVTEANGGGGAQGWTSPPLATPLLPPPSKVFAPAVQMFCSSHPPQTFAMGLAPICNPSLLLAILWSNCLYMSGCLNLSSSSPFCNLAAPFFFFIRKWIVQTVLALLWNICSEDDHSKWELQLTPEKCSMILTFGSKYV